MFPAVTIVSGPAPATVNELISPPALTVVNVVAAVTSKSNVVTPVTSLPVTFNVASAGKSEAAAIVKSSSCEESVRLVAAGALRETPVSISTRVTAVADVAVTLLEATKRVKLAVSCVR